MTASQLHTILLAEDDQNVRELSVMVLETVGGFAVTACGDGRQALAEVERRLPDLIILDRMMPRLDGNETIAALKADPRTRHIPVVFMTARARPDDVASMLALGAAAVVAKPFDPIALPDRLRRIWAEATGGG